MGIEARFRQAIARAIKPRRAMESGDPMQEVLSAFKTVLGKNVQPQDACFEDIPMDSLDLVEVTCILDEKFGDLEWQEFLDMATTRFILNQHPALTPAMMAEFIRTTLSTSPPAL